MTGAQLITRLRSAMKDTVPAGSTSRVKRSDETYASFLTDAQTFLNEELELCRKEFSLTLQADTREYTLNSGFIKFPTDRMKKRAGLVYWADGSLAPIDISDLDVEAPGWRDGEAGTPSQFYVQRGMPGSELVLRLGFDKTPNAAFVADPASLTYYGVYRPADIAANGLQPFDDSDDLAGLHNLLVLHSLVFLEAEDGNLEKSQERWNKFIALVEAAADRIKPAGVRRGGGMRPDPRWKQ